MKTLMDRFMSRVMKTETCWNWTGKPTTWGTGYGRMKVNGKEVLAHRLSYSLLMGPLDPKLVIDHLCRNTMCVNPAHLEQVPFRINVLRGQGPTALNARKTHCKYGHPLSGENLYRLGKRRCCRSCNRRAVARYEGRLS